MGGSIDLTLAFAATLALFVYLGWMHRTDNADEYHTVRRQAGVLRTAASFFTVVGAPHFTFMTLLAYTYGWRSIALYAGSFLGYIALMRWSHKIRAYKDHKPHSFADIATTQLGYGAGVTLTGIGVLFSFAVTVMQVVVGASIISQVAGMNSAIAVGLLVVAIWGYLYWGGYVALLLTDVIQAAIMIALTALLAWYVWFYGPSLSAAQSIDWLNPGSGSWLPLVAVLFLAGFSLELGAASNWQRILTAKTNDKAKKSLFWGGLSILLWGALVVSIGVSIANLFPNLEPSGAFIEVSTQHFPYWLTGLIVVLLLASLISTADTTLFMAAVLLQKSELKWLQKKFEKIRANAREQELVPSTEGLSIDVTKWLLTYLSVGVACFAIFIPDSASAWGFVLSMAYVAGPTSLAIVLNRGGRTRAIQAMVITRAMWIALAAWLLVTLIVRTSFSAWDFVILGIAAAPLLLPGPPKNDGLTAAAASSEKA
jgi:Na+/proline symporter